MSNDVAGGILIMILLVLFIYGVLTLAVFITGVVFIVAALRMRQINLESRESATVIEHETGLPIEVNDTLRAAYSMGLRPSEDHVDSVVDWMSQGHSVMGENQRW